MNERIIMVALPSFNEEAVIFDVIAALKPVQNVQLVVIDDGSIDDTATLVRNHEVTVIHHACNRGPGAASQSAIEWARKKGADILILMDADGQHREHDIENLIAFLDQSKADIIIGNRFHDGNKIPRSRRVFNAIANSLTNFFCQNQYRDTQSGFRALGKRAIQKLNLKVDGFGFCSEMIIVAENTGLTISELPISVQYSKYSMSKGQSLGRGITTAFHFLWRVIFD